MATPDHERYEKRDELGERWLLGGAAIATEPLRRHRRSPAGFWAAVVKFRYFAIPDS